MKLNYLKEGMIIEKRNGERGVILNGRILGNKWCYLSSYNQDLTRDCDSELDIVKVYKTNAYKMKDILDSYYLELIWEREEEEKIIDFEKTDLQTGTEILVRDFDYQNWKKAIFINYSKERAYGIKVVDLEEKEVTYYKHAKLIKEE